MQTLRDRVSEILSLKGNSELQIFSMSEVTEWYFLLKYNDDDLANFTKLYKASNRLSYKDVNDMILSFSFQSFHIVT